MRILLLSFVLFATILGCDVQKGSQSLYQEILIESGDGQEFINITDEVPKSIEETTYAWYDGKRVQYTQSNFDGALLHGKYLNKYPSGQIRSSGQYEYGLKSDDWRYHDASGAILRITPYDAGLKDGEERVFQGDSLLAAYLYKNGLLTDTLSLGK